MLIPDSWDTHLKKTCENKQSSIFNSMVLICVISVQAFLVETNLEISKWAQVTKERTSD